MLQRNAEGGQRCAPAASLLLGSGPGCNGHGVPHSAATLQPATTAGSGSVLSTVAAVPRALGVMVPSGGATGSSLLAWLGCSGGPIPIQNRSGERATLAWVLSRAVQVCGRREQPLAPGAAARPPQACGRTPADPAWRACPGPTGHGRELGAAAARRAP